MECLNGETLNKCARQCVFVCVSLLGEEEEEEGAEDGDEKTNIELLKQKCKN